MQNSLKLTDHSGGLFTLNILVKLSRSSFLKWSSSSNVVRNCVYAGLLWVFLKTGIFCDNLARKKQTNNNKHCIRVIQKRTFNISYKDAGHVSSDNCSEEKFVLSHLIHYSTAYDCIRYTLFDLYWNTKMY